MFEFIRRLIKNYIDLSSIIHHDRADEYEREHKRITESLNRSKHNE